MCPLYEDTGATVCNMLVPYNLVCLLQHSDMNEEMRVEAMELCVTACEKFSSNNEVRQCYIELI